VLSTDGHSPLPPKSGDEEAKGNKDKEAETKDKEPNKSEASANGKKPADEDKPEKPAKATRVDSPGLAQRFVPIPVAERNYERLLVGSDGALFYLSRRQAGSSIEPPGPNRNADADLYRFNFEDREEKLIKSHLVDFSSSADRKKLLLTVGEGKLEVADANEKLDSKPVDLSNVRMLIDPRQEWRQIFDETWRMEHEYFYDPKMHGLNWTAIRTRYEPLLQFVQRREDLNDLLVEMIGEMQVGHNRIGGGDIYAAPSEAIGLLGADFVVENNQYRIQKIYRGDRWNPFLVAPLSTAGVDVAEGDVIVAINGRPLDGSTNLFALLAGTAGKQVALTVSRDGKGTHTATVIPIANESALRQWNWVEANREYVERKSGGKVAYVYLPDTAGDGYTFFNRMFFAQVDKAGLIVDDRRNSGGQAANYVLEVLNRKYLSGWKDRDALVFNTPAGGIYGPKAMLIDQDAGSGGDFLPYGFKRLGLGRLIGSRTWGGLIGISANPSLIDGGFLSVPFFRVFTPEGEWHVENEGVAPDVDVPLDPLAVNAGNDVQLDAAVADVLQQLKNAPEVPRKSAPPIPTQVGR
jgi:tricorn protease